MRYLSVINKTIHIDNLVFDLTERIKITDGKKDLCILNKKDSRDINLSIPRGQILKLYLNVNDDWLYFDKLIYTYDTLKVDKESVDKMLLSRKEMIKEIIKYGI